MKKYFTKAISAIMCGIIVFSLTSCNNTKSILTAEKWIAIDNSSTITFKKNGKTESEKAWTLKDNTVTVGGSVNYTLSKDTDFYKLQSVGSELFYVRASDHNKAAEKIKIENLSALSAVEWKSMLDGSVLKINADGTATKNDETVTLDVKFDKLTIRDKDGKSAGYKITIENGDIKRLVNTKQITPDGTEYNYFVPSKEYDVLAEPAIAKLRSELTEGGTAFMSTLVGNNSTQKATTMLYFNDNGSGKMEAGMVSLYLGTFEPSGITREFNSWEIAGPGTVIYRMDQLTMSGTVTEANKANYLQVFYDKDGSLKLYNEEVDYTYSQINMDE